MLTVYNHIHLPQPYPLRTTNPSAIHPFTLMPHPSRKQPSAQPGLLHSFLPLLSYSPASHSCTAVRVESGQRRKVLHLMREDCPKAKQKSFHVQVHRSLRCAYPLICIFLAIKGERTHILEAW